MILENTYTYIYIYMSLLPYQLPSKLSGTGNASVTVWKDPDDDRSLLLESQCRAKTLHDLSILLQHHDSPNVALNRKPYTF